MTVAFASVIALTFANGKNGIEITPGLKGFPGTNALAYFGDKEKKFYNLDFRTK